MAAASLTKDTFGKTKDGYSVDRYILKNDKGVKVEILTLGGILQKLYVPDKDGNADDIITGYDNVEGYMDNRGYFGALVGRVANRIHKGKFTLDGQDYSLVVNNGPNHLHGGTVGFDKKIWVATEEGNKLKLSYNSPDGEEGYPGQMDVSVTYELTPDNELVIDYTATTTKPTPINLTNHTYFNLSGHKHKDVYEQIITMPSEKFTPKNEDNVPSGEITSVAGSAFDLRGGVALGKHINEIPDDIGYDHNYCVEGDGDKKLAARVVDPKSGRVLECFTTAPGVQLYTGNYLDMTGKEGVHYSKHAAFCLETQNYPDAINKPNFPSAVLRPGETYRHTTWYKFSTTNNS